MTVAAALALNVEVVAGLLIFGCCVFTAGWVARGERDLYRSVYPAKRRWRQTRTTRSRTPW